MRLYVGSQEAVNAFELDELAHGYGPLPPEDFRDLFLGQDDESEQQRAAREMAARDVLAELIERSDDDECAMLNALYAAQLMALVPLRRRADALPNSVRQAA
ncbi:hypothetical protein ACFT9I_28955 [Streptomyces sp. NPDC057137]|uniref:hypothetical protein n=1 Tax=Streptomyces sp. NPDC057137 TaxID=3346030 RepID=UPI00362864B6